MKTLHSSLNNEQLPIPLEYVYFIQDGEQDKTRPNRYYFEYPQEWMTSNKGETIVGVRSIWITSRRKKMVFKLKIRKYYRKDFDELKMHNPNTMYYHFLDFK